jgi:hypothetical protein
MEVRLVDPRDTDWEIVQPMFRVYFWEPQPAPPGVPKESAGYRSTEFEVSGVDVSEVLAWAETNTPSGATRTIYAVVEQGNRRGLVRLAGTDPTAAQVP